MNLHSCSTRHNNVTVKILSDIKITLHDRVVGSFVNTRSFETKEGRLEESFRGTESIDPQTIRNCPLRQEREREKEGRTARFQW